MSIIISDNKISPAIGADKCVAVFVGNDLVYGNVFDTQIDAHTGVTLQINTVSSVSGDTVNYAYIPDKLLIKNSDGNYTNYDVEKISSVPSSIQLLRLPKNLKMSDRQFQNLTSLNILVISEGIREITSRAFNNCTGLSEITLPSTIKTIGEEAFIGNALQKVHIRDLAKWCSIEGLYNLNSPGHSDKKLYVNGNLVRDLNIPNSVTSVADYAFYNYAGNNFTSLTIPDTIKSVGKYAFPAHVFSSNCVTVSDNLRYAGNSTNNYFVLLGPQYHNSTTYTLNQNTKIIAGAAFNDCQSVKSITVPGGVTSIGDEAFANCPSLEHIYIPTTVLHIGTGVFDNCPKLLYMSYDNADYLGWRDGYDNAVVVLVKANSKTITSCNIQPNTRIIYANAFKDCELQNVKLPSVPGFHLEIGDRAFYGCGWLTSTGTEDIIPNTTTYIGEQAFYYCQSLKGTLTIPSSVKSIGNGAFEECTGIEGVVIKENSIEVIPDDLFYHCTAIQSVTITAEITSIGEAAFSGCTKLESITIPSTASSIGDYAFSGCTALKTVNIRRTSYTTIGEYAFSYCGITSIVLPRLVTIPVGAFEFCSSLTTVKIPLSVKYIHNRAFYYCESLTKIVYEGTEAQWNAIQKGTRWDEQTGAYTITYNG